MGIPILIRCYFYTDPAPRLHLWYCNLFSNRKCKLPSIQVKPTKKKTWLKINKPKSCVSKGFDLILFEGMRSWCWHGQGSRNSGGILQSIWEGLRLLCQMWRHENGRIGKYGKRSIQMFFVVFHLPNFLILFCVVIHQAVSNYGDVIMGAIASQITSLTIVYSTVYSDADQRKHQSSASLAFVRGIHREPVNFPHKWPVTRKMFPFDDVIMGNMIICPNRCYVYVTTIFWINGGPVWYMRHQALTSLLLCNFGHSKG